MMYMVMGGIALIAIAFIIFVTIRFQTMEAVYFREYGRKTKGTIIEVDKSSAEYHSGQKNQSYDIKVRFEHEGEQREGCGVITAETYAGHEEGDEIEFYYDPMNTGVVIFYEPEKLAGRGQKFNKIAMVLLVAGFVLFVVGRVMM